MKFRSTVLQSGKNTTGMEIPEEVVTALGSGKKPPVRARDRAPKKDPEGRRTSRSGRGQL
jgi:hypothetical protein